MPAIFGARVALLTDGMPQSAETGERADCEKILKKAGYSMPSLKIK